MKHIFILVLITVAVIVAGIGAYYISISTDQYPVPTTTTQGENANVGQTTGQQDQTINENTNPPQDQIDLSGTWRGTFTATNWPGESQGEWEWIIYRVNGNEYKGYIKVMNVYPTNGYIPITVSLDGNKIRVGTVGGLVVVFTGTVSDDGKIAHGTWKFSNEQDYGSWSGRKVSSETIVPGMTTTQEQSTTQSITTTHGTTTTSQEGARCGLILDKDLAKTYDEAIAIFSKVFNTEPRCVGSTMLDQQSFMFHLKADGVDEAKMQDYLTGLTTALQAYGFTIHASGVSGNEITIISTKTVGDKKLYLNIIVDLADNNADIGFQITLGS